jgi:hypothetical protein
MLSHLGCIGLVAESLRIVPLRIFADRNLIEIDIPHQMGRNVGRRSEA